MENYGTVIAVFEACGKIHSRLKAQKLFYILKSLGYPISERYKYKDYGPYSEELASELETAVRLGYLEEVEIRKEPVSEEDSPYTRFDLEITPKGRDFLAKFTNRQVDSEVLERLSRTAKALNSYSPTELELMATLLYVRNVGVKADHKKYVMSLKPKFKGEHIDIARTKIKELEEKFGVAQRA